MTRFTVFKHLTDHTHTDLIIEVNSETISLLLPKGLPRELGSRKLAIETEEVFENSDEYKGHYGQGTSEVVDTGELKLEYQNQNKKIFHATGDVFRGRFILLLPSWGRWTRHTLWTLEKIPPQPKL